MKINKIKKEEIGRRAWRSDSILVEEPQEDSEDWCGSVFNRILPSSVSDIFGWKTGRWNRDRNR